MKIGDIIRRKCSTDGKPIGPYMRIMVIKDDRVYADTIGEDEPNIIILKRNCYVCKVRQLIVPEDTLNKLKLGRISTLERISCKTWYAVYKNKPDLIMFRSPKNKEKTLFSLDNVKTKSSLGRYMICITPGYKIE